MITPYPAITRSADHTAWGMALLRQKAPADAVDREWMEAVRISNGGTREVARMLHRMLLANRPVDARRILREYPGNDPYRRFYDAKAVYDGSGKIQTEKVIPVGGRAEF